MTDDFCRSIYDYRSISTGFISLFCSIKTNSSDLTSFVLEMRSEVLSTIYSFTIITIAFVIGSRWSTVFFHQSEPYDTNEYFEISVIARLVIQFCAERLKIRTNSSWAPKNLRWSCTCFVIQKLMKSKYYNQLLGVEICLVVIDLSTPIFSIYELAILYSSAIWFRMMPKRCNILFITNCSR